MQRPPLESIQSTGLDTARGPEHTDWLGLCYKLTICMILSLTGPLDQRQLQAIPLLGVSNQMVGAVVWADRARGQAPTELPAVQVLATPIIEGRGC